jgi:N-acetylglucosaminyldiphosphoundecaprenol N-acetyl-beta-D-mannosaminyltransferase
MSRADRIELMQCAFDPVGVEAALERCLGWCLGPRASHTLVTMNASLICMMRRDTSLRHACLRGDLIVADGVPLVWASRLAGCPLPERVAGVDLMTALLGMGSEHRLGAYFLGAKPEVVSEMTRRVAGAHPGLRVLGARDGYFGPAESSSIVTEVRGLAPHMLFVGMPSPFKEIWCEENRDALQVPLIMGVGGSFDVLAGHVRRAPRAMQKLGLEWSWRLAMEPRKMWKRYLLSNTEFMWLATREILARRVGLHRDPEPEGPSRP